MKKLILSIVLVMGGAAALTGYVIAADAPTTKPAAADAKPVNTKCPVSGEDIDPKVTTVYKGKTIAFCCSDCPAKFKADPEKYMKDLK